MSQQAEAHSIGAIAKRAGVATSAIRYYESIGLLPPPARENGRRRYDGAVLARLRLIKLAQDAGFSISEIQTLLHRFPVDTPPPDRWRAVTPAKIAEIDARIENLQRMRALLAGTLGCACASLDGCADTASLCGG